MTLIYQELNTWEFGYLHNKTNVTYCSINCSYIISIIIPIWLLFLLLVSPLITVNGKVASKIEWWQKLILIKKVYKNTKSTSLCTVSTVLNKCVATLRKTRTSLIGVCAIIRTLRRMSGTDFSIALLYQQNDHFFSITKIP